ncbi:LLM class flavin-dependent oxidoreductase [Oerskovia flava]|uniref:LLM class flavin-dependent oxidoreductase n=1 Tax=Oerskovia flava TaxID=2986422 RepID=UPI00223EB22E|nr:LLM class flavin-dependent oxidoreductase [Oerskovia sp. JB1-3-2]
MRLGFYTFGDNAPDPLTGEQTAVSTRLRDVLERIRLADEVGLDYAGIGEHHRPDYAISSPATVIAAALAQTERITVGSAVTVLSTEDPVRVYQQFATMDQISGGRVELLAGRGSFIESYPLFGADLEDYDALFDEKIMLLRQIDQGNPVTWSGRFRAPLTGAEILPRPFDKPGRGERLDIAIATGGNPQSSVRAGVLGMPVNYAIIGGRPAQFAPLVDLYRRAADESGHDGAALEVSVSTMGFVGDDSRGARDFYYPYYLQNMKKISAERGFPLPNRLSYDATAAPGGAYFIGEPEEVADKIITLHGALGHDRHILQMDLSGVPQRESLRAIELLGTQVAPRVREALAD